MQHFAPDDQVCEDVHADAELAMLQNGKAIAEVQNQSVTIQGTQVQLPATLKFLVFSPTVSASVPVLRSVIIGPAAPRDPKDPMIPVRPLSDRY